jgi:hypothetical protein
MKVENNFIQWKGTDICMDFHCECGYHNHYDGYFAYFVRCKKCKQVYKLDTKVMMEKRNDIEELYILEDIDN